MNINKNRMVMYLLVLVIVVGVVYILLSQKCDISYAEWSEGSTQIQTPEEGALKKYCWEVWISNLYAKF